MVKVRNLFVGFFFLGIKRLLVCLDCGCPRRAPSLPSGREPAANWIPGIHFRGLAVPEGLSDCAEASQTVQRPLRLCRTACLGKRRRRESPLFWDMLGTPCAPAVAILPSAMYLPKRTSIRAKIMLFGNPLPPGGGDYLALARTSTLSQGIPIKSLPPTPPHRAHRYPCCA